MENLETLDLSNLEYHAPLQLELLTENLDNIGLVCGDFHCKPEGYLLVPHYVTGFNAARFGKIIGKILLRLMFCRMNWGVSNERADGLVKQYRSGTVNSNTVNSKFHLIRSLFEIFARFLSFHV